MKIFIQYENNKDNIEINKYESINSIISKYLNLGLNNKIINKDTNDFFLDYNGQYLNKDTCLDKYINSDIYKDNTLLFTLHEKKRGGSNFISFATKNPFTVVIVLIIVLIPLFILPAGFVPLISALIKNIIEKCFDHIGKYLSCVLGKKTLYRRIKLILVFLQYFVVIVMIFIIIVFPIILLCITLKGHSLGDNPKSMCSPISVGNMVGMILVICYAGLYLLFRCGNYIFEGLLYITKMSYYLNMFFSPTFKSILKIYDRIKYIPIYAIPFVGQGILAYNTSMELTLIGVEVILGTVASMGCSVVDTSKIRDGIKGVTRKMKDGKKFISSVMKKVDDLKGQFSKLPECECKRKEREKEIQEEDKDENEIPDFKQTDYLCNQDKLQCCAPERYVGIADTLGAIINNPMLSAGLKAIGLFPAFVLFTTALYETALLALGDTDDVLTKTIEQKKFYLRKILKDKVGILEDDTKKMIKDYLDDQEINKNSNTMIYEIKKMIDRNSPPDNEGIKILKDRILNIEESMIDYAKESGTVYVPGNSLFKNVFKILFMDIFCNIASTSKSGKDIIKMMGSMTNVVDMMKAGTASGVITSIVYFIAVIILIICGIFNMF